MSSKTFRDIFIPISLFIAAIAIQGCDKSSDSPTEPSIEIAMVNTSSNSVTFAISTKYAEEARYLIRPSKENIPDVAEVLSKGKVAGTNETVTYTTDGLLPDTEYIIYAAARNKDKTSFMSILAKTNVSYDASFNGQNVLAIYYGNRDTRSKDKYNYYLVISDVGFSPEMYPNPDGKFFFRIDLYYDKAEDPDNAFIPDGTYEFDGLHDEPESGLLGNRSGFFQTDDLSFHKDKHDFESAVLSVTTTANGKKYHLIATLDNGKEYELTFEGHIQFENQSGESINGQKDQLPPLENDINTVFSVGEGSIIAQQGEFSQVSLAFSDMSVVDGQLTPPGNLLDINIITVLQDGKIPERTFTLQNGDSDKNFLIPGQEEYEAGTYYPAFSYVQNYVTSNSSTTGYVNGGSVTVKKSAKGYSFMIEVTTKDGHKVTGSYDGTFPLYGPGNSTLTEDYNISFSSDTKGSAVYYGDYYSTGTANWMLVLMPESGKGDAFYMECFNHNLDFTKGFSAGTYNPDNTGKSMTFLPGAIDDKGQLANTYYAYVDGNNIYRFAPITGGNVKITYNGETSNVSIDGIDDSGHKVTGSWSGTLKIITNTSPTARMSLRNSSISQINSAYKDMVFKR